MLTNPTVCAVVLTHHPDICILNQLVEATAQQVSALVLVDNGSAEQSLSIVRCWPKEVKKTNLSVLELGENIGVAAAQNIGIFWARKRAYSHILFLDQDSIPTSNMVDALMQALYDLTSKSVPVAAVGPCLVDRRTGRVSPFTKWFDTFHWKTCGDNWQHFKHADFLVSSGMLVPMSIFDQVGILEEGLFIDNVDMEWCFRVQAKGLLLYGVCDAVMQHSIGDKVLRIGASVIHRHNPLRQYYIMRNRLLLYKRKYSPVGWILQDIPRMLFKVIMFSIVFPPRFENICMIFRGIRDACVGRQGKYRGY